MACKKGQPGNPCCDNGCFPCEFSFGSLVLTTTGGSGGVCLCDYSGTYLFDPSPTTVIQPPFDEFCLYEWSSQTECCLLIGSHSGVTYYQKITNEMRLSVQFDTSGATPKIKYRFFVDSGNAVYLDSDCTTPADTFSFPGIRWEREWIGELEVPDCETDVTAEVALANNGFSGAARSQLLIIGTSLYQLETCVFSDVTMQLAT
jgi:hypothetical protein